METTHTPAHPAVYELGEGPVWDAPRQRLLWVDILGGAVVTGTLDGLDIAPTGRLDFGEMVGAVTVAEDGRLLVAAQETLVEVDPEGVRVPGARLVPEGSGRRLNDGATDPAGRFLVGTLSLTGDSSTETLVRVEPDGRVTGIDDDLTLSNGLAWSTDGRRMFSVDTRAKRIWVRDYDAATGAVGERRVHLGPGAFGDGFPDGIAVDSADHLWVAVWGAGQVRRHAPDGTGSGRVTVPAPHTSSLAFAGADLDVLVITTATSELPPAELVANPHSGCLFATRVDVPGHPVPPWAGFRTDPTTSGDR